MRTIPLSIIKLGKSKFHCWKRYGHGYVNLGKALQQSCDTYFYDRSVDIGIDAIAQMARRFGLGTDSGFDLEGGRTGLMPDKNWKYGRFGERWHPGETVVASIGQGYILATPLQLAVMIARIVNGGFAVKPWITAYLGDKDLMKGPWPSMNIKASHLRQVMKGMEKVVNSKRGTAYGSRIEEKGMEMAGKTGTAQVRRITKEQRKLRVKNADLPWEQRHHALFVGYAPLKKPRYVCSVVVEHGIGGSRSAAPIAKELLLQAQIRNPSASGFKQNIGMRSFSDGIARPGRKPRWLTDGNKNGEKHD